jgi:hypothetical protein
MDQRVDVTDQEMIDAVRVVTDSLQRRVAEKGRKCYIGPHEIYGTAAEEFNKELLDAMHKNDREGFCSELVDVAVTCLFGLASIRARARVEAQATPPLIK